MRWTVALLFLSTTPTLATVPPPLCAMSGPTPVAALDRPAVAEGSGIAPPASGLAKTGNPQSVPVPTALAAIPFVEHVVSAGATLTDLGLSHGLRAVAARSGDQFMLFDITPDGQAAVSGAPIALSLAQLQSIAARDITELGEMHGLHGYFVRSGQQFQVFYASPDGEQLIPGVMWDASGKDLTRQQVSRVPGAVPTVEVGDTATSQAAGAAALPLVKKAALGTIGPDSAPRLYMMIDPQCIYSMRAFQMLRPYVEAGRLQISVIPLSVLDYEDRGQSTRSALALLSNEPGQIVNAWQSGSENNAPNADARNLLGKNMAIAEAIGLKGTPTFVWRKPDGTEGRLDGLPADVPAFIASIGS